MKRFIEKELRQGSVQGWKAAEDRKPVGRWGEGYQSWPKPYRQYTKGCTWFVILWEIHQEWAKVFAPDWLEYIWMLSLKVPSKTLQPLNLKYIQKKEGFNIVGPLLAVPCTQYNLT